MNDSQWSDEFPQDPNLIYLNHAAVAPWPKRTCSAVQAFAEENMTRGAADYPRWMATEARLRQALGSLIGAHADEVSLLKNTSEALSVVAHGLDWKSGDNVVISDEEFPSNRIVWESLSRQGVEVRRTPLTGPDEPEQALLQRTDRRTRLLAISSVQYASGLRMDLHQLGAALKQRGVLFCVDAIQSIGAEPLDVDAIQADFVAADGHKWMLGPEGLALFYCRAALRDQLQLRQYGWHMVAEAGNFDATTWTPASDARRFECGSPNMLGVTALHASVALLQLVGIEHVAARIRERVGLLLEAFSAHPDIKVLTPKAPQRHLGICTFRRRDEAPEVTHERLKAAGVVCAQRGGGVRFSPHFYTPIEALERACALVLNAS